MDSGPLIFFHFHHYWNEGTDPILLNCRSITEPAAQPLLSSLKVNVSNPKLLLAWLETNPVSYITSLHVHLDAYASNSAASIGLWKQLFEKLAREAANLLHLSVYWDAEGWMRGLGADVAFVRALVLLKVKETVKIGGFYGMHWPEFLETRMGLKPVDESLRDGTWRGILKGFQRGSEGIVP
jgi:hypothetical protein